MTVGAGEALVIVGGAVLDEEVVVGSLQPNQPGVSQVVGELLKLELTENVVVVVDVVVVVSSRHPNHPGVRQVSVRVLVRDTEVLVALVALVVVSVPLLSKKFHA